MHRKMTAFPVKVKRGLEVLGGKFAKIESSASKGTCFVVKPSQTVSDLTVYKVLHMPDNIVHLAFCFKLKENMYFPVVERDSATKEVRIKVVGPINETFNEFPVMYLFRWDSNGEYGSLCSVAEPSQYLSACKGRFITLSPTPDLSFRINLNTYETRMASPSLNPLIYIQMSTFMVECLHFGSSSEKENDVGSDMEHSFNMCTPKPIGTPIHGEKRDPSVIKYKITATPGGKRSQQKQRPGQVNGHELRFFTPVRRSLRIEKTASHYPAILQEHDNCVASLHELLAQSESQSEITRTAETSTSPLYVYRENDALKEHVRIKLVYDATVES